MTSVTPHTKCRVCCIIVINIYLLDYPNKNTLNRKKFKVIFIPFNKCLDIINLIINKKIQYWDS